MDDARRIKLQINTHKAPTFSCDVESIGQQLGQRVSLDLLELVVPIVLSQGQRLELIDHHP